MQGGALGLVEVFDRKNGRMDREHNGAGGRELSQRLPFGSQKPAVLRQVAWATCLASWAEEIWVIVEKRVGPPERLFRADSIEQALDTARDVVVVGRNGLVNPHERLSDLFGKGPACGKAQDCSNEDVLS